MMFMGCTVTILGPTLQVILMPSPIMSPLTLFGPMFLVGLGNGMTLPNASSGMVSINPKLAGSASGLGMAIMIGTGAAISAFTGSILGSGESPYPLILMVLFATIMSSITSFSVFKIGEPK
jgi:DHA1 family bicyclomycin/chloramphenicol resistance-like MFS transporter